MKRARPFAPVLTLALALLAPPAPDALCASGRGSLRALIDGLFEGESALREARSAGFLLYQAPAITDALPGPGSFPGGAVPARRLSVAACRGEYEPLCVIVEALREVRGLEVVAGPLTGPGGALPPEAVDVRVIAWWYQAGTHLADVTHKRLVPELLLKDESLVKVDPLRESNYLRAVLPDGTTGYVLASGPDSEDLKALEPTDSDSLLPVAVAAGSLKHFLITVHVPEQAAPGLYRGKIVFRSPEGSLRVPLAVTVHPFDLEPPPLTYAMYYRGKLSEDGRSTIGSEWKSDEQYRVELNDMKAHGFLYPSNFLRWEDDRIVRALELRRSAGLPTDAFFTLGLQMDRAIDGPGLPDVLRDASRLLAIVKPFGYRDVYFYGLDEARGEALIAERPVLDAVQQQGGKTFVACYKGTFEAVGPLLDLAVQAYRPDPEEARKWHGVGSKIFCYSFPQAGQERPLTYRRNYGLILWKAGYDGAMPYAYQSEFGHIWNDFDSGRYRDHCLAYPTRAGVIGTLQWEGLREAVDDVRYATTLERAIAAAPAARQETARAARAWLDSLDVDNADLDAARRQAADWITKLR